MSKIIVFGGAGFLGSHVADELTLRGHEVTVFDWNRSQHLLLNQKMIIGDILNRDAVRNAVKDTEIVYHFAAMADIQEARDNPVNSANFNIIGTMYILDACREYGIKRFVYSSTIYVYSDHGSFYRSSKQACELFIENYHKEYNVDFTILRYGSLYGKRANNFNFIRNSIRQALLEGKIVRNGDGEEIRDYVNILDAARSSVDALDQEYRNSFLMITGPQTMKVKELLLMIKEIMGDEIELVFTNDKMAGHYKITPYSFKPKVALKLMPKDFHDLGQGVLDSIYEIYQDLLDEGLKPKLFQQKASNE
jgi:UDP-glucose 4-epimerase